MSGGGRRYGVQVGNETYSLVLTQEDWEKRRLDREHARKLSLANNKRRKALDDRKRVAEARENRKRELELFKRRQRQIEATERYQRFHITAKDKRAQNSDFTQGVPNLEEVLQRLRGGDGDGIVGTVPDNEKQPVAAIEENQQNSSNDKPAQGLVMERLQWQNMKEYAEDLKRQIFNMQYKKNQMEDKAKEEYFNDDDGQDSLHGSSISGSSQPSYSSPTVTQGCPENVDPINESVKKPSPVLQESPNQEEEIPDKNAAAIPNQDEIRPPQDENLLGIVRGSETGVLCKRDSQTGRITYYVKAYRPWSATIMNKPFQNAFHHNHTTNSLLIRPSSSYESRRRVPSSDYTSTPKPPQRHYDTWTSNNTSGHIVQHSNKLSEPTEEKGVTKTATRSVTFSDPIATHAHIVPTQSLPQQISSASIGITTATPVSPFFDSGRDRNSGALITRFTSAKNDSSAGFVSDPSHFITSESTTKPPATATYSQTLVTPVSADAVKVLNEMIEKEKPVDTDEKVALKGILRRYSKYDSGPSTKYGMSQPSYQSAGIARQKWLHGINLGPPQNDATREPRIRSAETTKSVRWHQVHYNDGSPSSMLDMHENATPPPPVPKPQPPTRVQGVSSARGVKSPRKPSTARPKTSPARGMRGGKVKASGRKLRPAKELPTNIPPHPPPQKQAPKLSMSTVINYSIDPGDEAARKKESKSNNGKTVPMKQRPGSSTKRMSPITHNKIVFHRKVRTENGEAVTMSTLKSRGNDSRTCDDGRDNENVIVSQGNQVTINVSSSKPIASTPNSRRSTIESGRIPLNGTPTDQEIEMLWDKVRSYLAWNKSRGNGTLVKKMHGVPERKVAWGPSQPEATPKHISANIISIDGGIFGKPAVDDSAFVTTQNQLFRNSHQIPVHYERFGIGKSRKVAYSPTVPSQEYGYCSTHAPQYQMRDKTRSTLPVTSNGHTHPSSAPVRRQPQLTDSVRTFRLVEALIEQNVPEEEILRALNSLQSATREV